MKVKVLFFGATADSVGLREAAIDLPEGADAALALSRIIDSFPGLSDRRDKKSLLFALNQQYASGNEAIREGDELAVFTAVSGG